MLNKLFRFSTPPKPSPASLILLILTLFALLSPQLAHAKETLMLGNNNAWPIFVYGNPRVVYDILVGASLMIDPQVGNSGFRYAMYAVSLVGFLVLAISAGYDPAKNFIKMFTYIIMVWMVTLFTFNLKVNADVVDVLSQDGNNSYIVQDAPALAVIPMSFMFTLGNYLNKQIELAYNIPNSYKTGTPGVGTFNLFGKMAADSGKYVISNSALRQSLAAYAADCVVPAIARNQLHGVGVNAAREPVTYYGTEAITKGSSYWTVLSTAKHNSILTKYYPDATGATWYASLPSGIKDALPSDPSSLTTVSPSTGIIVPCAAAYDAMDADLEAQAQSLKTQSAAQFASTGTVTVYETIFDEFLKTTATKYSTPGSYIKQQALVDISAETFRSAALSTGNSEVMQAFALSQAETQQKSTWSAAFYTFNNMMGYVYVVLQAFIFAITPIILLALVVPGMGSKITANYIQILLWLALWPVMLGIINYVITLFGIDAVKGAYADQGGYRNLANTALLTERTNDLVLAAQFLGTMVPMISWGIIKGAMAFTEFISAGVGSQFASQAGAQAATGNFSLNNGSMNNLTLDKMSTAMSSSVGFDAVKAANSAAATDLSTNQGGTALAAAGKGVDLSRALSQSAQAAERFQESVGSTVTSALSNAKSWSQAVDNVKASSSGTSQQAALQALSQLAHNAGVDKSASKAIAAGNSDAVQKSIDAQSGGANSARVTGGAKVPTIFRDLVGLEGGVEGAIVKDASFKDGVSATGGANAGTTAQAGDGQHSGVNAVVGKSTAELQAAGKGLDNTQRINAGHGFNQQESLQKAVSLQKQRSTELQAAIGESRTLSMATNLDATRANAVLARLDALTGSHLKDFDKLEQERLAATKNADGKVDATSKAVGDPDKPGVLPAEAQRLKGIADAAGARAARDARTVPTAAATGAGVADAKAKAGTTVETVGKNVVERTEDVAKKQAELKARAATVATAVKGSAVAGTAHGNAQDAYDTKPGAQPPAPPAGPAAKVVHAAGGPDPATNPPKIPR